jgi:hypothetical protein
MYLHVDRAAAEVPTEVLPTGAVRGWSFDVPWLVRPRSGWAMQRSPIGPHFFQPITEAVLSP